MKNELTYTKVGDYNLPNLTLQNPQTQELGRYGRMRREYLKNHRPILYNRLILSEKLFLHLTEIEETANRRIAISRKILRPMAAAAAVPIRRTAIPVKAAAKETPT